MGRRHKHFMIKLENIKKINSIISCRILPEDAESYGSLVVDVVNRSIIDYDLPDGYQWCKNHVVHAAEALFRMALLNDIPSEKKVAWG